MHAPMIVDGVIHWFSDLAGIGQGFRHNNAWLVTLTRSLFPQSFYVGNLLGSFNSWMRLIIGLLFGLAVAAGCAAVTKSPGQIELSAAEFDFGIISNTEPVSQVFQVRNVGQGRLEVIGVSTSCGCTTAEIGSLSLASGEVANLTVTYDPQAHDGATGEFVRLVYVRSNDPATPEARLTIRVTVVEPGRELDESYVPIGWASLAALASEAGALPRIYLY